MAPPSNRVFIIVRAPNGDVREVPVGATASVIGRDESADIRVDDKKVSRRHAAFKLIEGEPWVEDLGSANGIKLNGKKVVKRAKLNPGDKVKVGGYEVSLRDRVDETGAAAAAVESAIVPVVSASRTKEPIAAREEARGGEVVLNGLDAPVLGRRFQIEIGENIIGRLEDCAVPVMDGSVSRQHARIDRTHESVSLSDLGSSNGSFVNDMRVDTTGLANGDRIRVGNIRFTISMPSGLSSKDAVPSFESAVRVKGVAHSRPWLMRGVIVLATTITLLSFLLYLKNRNRTTGSDDVVAWNDASDAGDASLPVAVAELDANSILPGDSGIEPDTGVGVELDAAVIEDIEVDAGVDAGVRETPDAKVEIAEVPTSTNAPRFDVPKVDETFDFDAFVEEKLTAARALELSGELPKLRVVLSELIERDPINKDAKMMLSRLVLVESAEDAMKKAEAFAAKNELSRALKLYASIPEGAPQSALARTRAEELKVKALAQELQRGESDLKDKDKKSWLRAHRRFRDVLELDPTSERALAGVRAAERKMRTKNVRFTAWLPAGEGGKQLNDSPADVEAAINQFHKGDTTVARIALLYAQGSVAKALKRADVIDKSSPGKKDEVKKLRKALKEIDGLYERIKNEIANDPNAAWSKLADLEARERTLLPKTVKSFVVKELEESIAEAFANAGASMFDREKYEDAFQRWDAGAKLDPKNPKVMAGLRKLEARAKTWADEAELASQRSERDGCNKWRAISRITRAESEMHKRATERAKDLCKG